MSRTSFSISTNTKPLGRSIRLVRPAGSRKKRPIANTIAKIDGADPGAAADLLLLALLVGRHLGVGRDVERLEADLQRLDERHDAAQDRQPRPAVLLGVGDERERDHLDLALRALLRIELAGLELLGGGLAHRHRPGGDAAHHHALEHGLTPDRQVAGRLELAVGGAHTVNRNEGSYCTGQGTRARVVALVALGDHVGRGRPAPSPSRCTPGRSRTRGGSRRRRARRPAGCRPRRRRR